jgi:hypothetical protein
LYAVEVFVVFGYVYYDYGGVEVFSAEYAYLKLFRDKGGFYLGVFFGGFGGDLHGTFQEFLQGIRAGVGNVVPVRFTPPLTRLKFVVNYFLVEIIKVLIIYIGDYPVG